MAGPPANKVITLTTLQLESLIQGLEAFQCWVQGFQAGGGKLPRAVEAVERALWQFRDGAKSV